jgi:AraC-like DNA-binding protein/quercetin dioxygenase-like cupin family protein
MHYNGYKLRANWRVHTANAIAGEVLYEPGGECGPRMQRDFELVILHSGACRVDVDGATRELRAGAVYLFLPGHREHFRFAGDRQTHHSFCSVHPAFMPKAFGRQLQKAVTQVNCSEVFRNLLRTVFKTRPPQNASARTMIDQMALCLFAEYLDSARRADSEPDQDLAVDRFRSHIEEHFGDADCLLQAHRAARVSRNGLILRFRSQMQMTPARYLWRVRVERGAAMLYETGYSISEIADQCGFKTPFHFSRLIKTHFGMSPKDLRNKAWLSKS